MKVVILKGGLGNQLFQLCFYFFLKEIFRKEKLLLDNKTGFLLDYKYKRNYELKMAKNFIRVTPKSFFLINILVLILDKYFSFLRSIIPLNIVNESNYIKYLNSFKTKDNILDNSVKHNKKTIFFNGYFHNYSIVKKVLPKIKLITESYFKKDSIEIFSKLYNKISNSSDPIALCIRFYEETNTKGSLEKKVGKTVEKYNSIISFLEKEINYPSFFIFIQTENKFTSKLKFNSPNYYITVSKGYESSWQTLKALSLCKHHIFNNSTFYWWGCVLSQLNERSSNEKSFVFASDNFTSTEIYNPNWNKF